MLIPFLLVDKQSEPHGKQFQSRCLNKIQYLGPSQPTQILCTALNLRTLTEYTMPIRLKIRPMSSYYFPIRQCVQTHACTNYYN